MSNELREAAEERRRLIAETRRDLTALFKRTVLTGRHTASADARVLMRAEGLLGELESEYEEIVRECDNADGVYKEETCL